MIWLTKLLCRRAASGKVLINKAFIIASDSKCDWYQRGNNSVVYKIPEKKHADTAGGAIKKITLKFYSNQQENYTSKSLEKIFKKT